MHRDADQIKKLYVFTHESTFVFRMKLMIPLNIFIKSTDENINEMRNLLQAYLLLINIKVIGDHTAKKIYMWSILYKTRIATLDCIRWIYVAKSERREWCKYIKLFFTLPELTRYFLSFFKIYSDDERWSKFSKHQKCVDWKLNEIRAILIETERFSLLCLEQSADFS